MNVVILILDTVGYNYTSLGGGPAQMSNLQEWADNNLHLTNYVAPATYTCQSMATILTGLSVLHHCTAMQVIPNWNIPTSIRTILDIFKESGYSCAVMGDIYHLPLLSRGVHVDDKPKMTRRKFNTNPDIDICEMFRRSEVTQDLEFVPDTIIENID